ncbi:hypothetical protein [Streptomyces sp. NRRL F-5527]|uniref:hypothetical protein n=1 Tax=Streptomyces sp. NRRL F-5527 TaxID=1463862 RepID=UPI0004C71890|nr:hypothetical protein [Streptomyces sp. NRRL F-5527]
MTTFHAAVVHPDQSVTYCGEVDQAHVDTVRALAEIDTVPRFNREHPSRPGSVFVLHDAERRRTLPGATAQRL